MGKLRVAMGATALFIASACTDRAILTDAGRHLTPGNGIDAAAIAGYTSIDPTIDGAGTCINTGTVNCNIYKAKEYVWMNGGPVSANLGDGTFFFAVLAPSGQSDPNDLSADLLSTDTYLKRSFRVSGTTVTNLGDHEQDGSKIRLIPFANNSPNGGGVYIMAICKYDPDLTPNPAGPPGVDPKDCKYDAFKVKTDVPVGDAGSPTVQKTASAASTLKYKWDITKDVDKPTSVTLVGSGTATFNYTVKVSHDAGTASGYTVSGTITVSNPNAGDVTGVNITDNLVNASSTACTVTGGSGATLKAGDNKFDYKCPEVQEKAAKNTVAITWPSQTVDLKNLSAGGDEWVQEIDYSDPTPVDASVDVTDVFNGEDPAKVLGTVKVGDANPTSFTYSRTVNYDDAHAGECLKYDNTATFKAASGATGDAKQEVEVCMYRKGTPPTVSKTAAGTSKLTYPWDIKKDVDKTSVTLLDKGSALFTYTVTVTRKAGVASDYGVTGVITVNNPNSQSVTGVNITDKLDDAALTTCTVTGGTNATLASGDTKFNYSCAPTTGLAKNNNVKIAWNDQDLDSKTKLAGGDASASASIAWASPTIVDGTVTITDTYKGTLGTMTYSDASPKTFTYSRTINYDDTKAPGCQSYDNTARFTTNSTGTTGSASQTVQVCFFHSALTIGYWSNHLAPTGDVECKKVPSGGSCSNNGPWAKNRLPQPLGSSFSVTTITIASSIFLANNCSSSTSQDAIGCLAAQLLAAELNAADPKTNQCILPKIAEANAFLNAIPVTGTPSTIPYIGPGGNYSKLTAAGRTNAIALKTALDNYNNNKGC